MTETVTISLEDTDHEGIAAQAAFRVLETFAAAAADVDKPVVEDTKIRLRHALKAFPELAHHTVTVGVLDPKAVEERDILGRARERNNLVLLPADRLTHFQTIYHELGHLAIHRLDEDGEDVPTTSEPFCSIFSIARMPQEYIDQDYIAYLGTPAVPSEEWPEICRRALSYREHSHDYIQQCKAWLEIDEEGDWDA